MKIAGYVSVLIFLVFGCAGRGEKMKDESELIERPTQREVFKVAYPELITMYNEGQIDEFYSILDTMIIKNPSSAIRITDPDDENKKNPHSAYSGIPIKITADSSLVSILILDVERKLLWIEYNNIMRGGDYLYFIEFPNIESGIYHYLVKVESEEKLRKFVLLK